MRENRTSGSVREVPGNRHSYRKRGKAQMADYLKKLIFELFFLRRASLAETLWFFDKKHNNFLVPQLDLRIGDVLDCFKKYRRVTYDMQGIRDHGIDVLLRYDIGEKAEHQMRYIGFQVKSYSDLSEKGWLTKLKAQVVDATNYVTMEDFYIIVCTVATEHISKLRDLQAELSKTESTHIVRPEYCLNFYRLSPQRIGAYLKAKLSEEDQVFREAFELLSVTPHQSAIVMELIVSHLLEGRSNWKPDELRQQYLIQSTYRELPNLPIEYFMEDENYDDEISAEEDLESAWLKDIEVLQLGFIDFDNRSDTIKLKQNEATAVATITLDGYVRYGYEGVDLRKYLMETLVADKLRSAEDYIDKTQR